jgi:hypothetical protein
MVMKVLALHQQGKWIDVSLLQQLCGKLQAMSLALPGVRVFTRALYALIARALEEDRTPRYKVMLSEYERSIDEITHWSQRLNANYNGLPIHLRTGNTKMWVDASDIGWGGEVNGKCFSGTLPIEEIQNSSARRELVGLLKLAEAAIDEIKNERVHVLMDSANAICNLLSGGGSKENLTDAVKAWVRFCEQHSITPTYQWIKREENQTADRYSKLPTIQYKLQSGVESAVRQWLEQVCHHPQRAATMPIFIPNFNVIPLRLESILMNMSEAVLIIPQWRSKSWWPTLLSHRVDSFYMGHIDRVLIRESEETRWNRHWTMEAHWLKGRRRNMHTQ